MTMNRCGDTMLEIQSLVNDLMDRDKAHAYQCLNQLEVESNHSAVVYPFFYTFIEMLDHKNSYIRTRGIILIAANVKWDVEDKLNKCMGKYLAHIMDDKPITARQCIKTLPALIQAKPELRDYVLQCTVQSKPTKISRKYAIISDTRHSTIIRNDLQAFVGREVFQKRKPATVSTWQALW